MRLKQTLQEAAEFQMVVKDIEPKMYELFRILKKNGFQMDDKSLEKSLNAIFKDKGIVFQTGPRRGPSFSHVISSAGITDDLRVVIEYVPGFSQYFRRYARPDKQELFYNIAKNEFFRTFSEVLAHEYKHLFQTLSVKGSKTIATDPKAMGFSLYLKTDTELDAFALQAAIQNLRMGGESSIISQYYEHFAEKDKKVWQNFVKKVYKNMKDLKKRGMEKYIRLR